MEIPESSGLISDEQIIDLYFRREEKAIHETDIKYGKYLLTIAHNILTNQDSEECLNDTYLKTWNAIPPARPNILKAFLAKIMRRTALDRYDEAKRLKRIPAELCISLSDFDGYLPDPKGIDEEMDAREIGRIISAYLRGVSDRKMYIFISRFFFLMPIAQIAGKLRCSESTVNKTLAAMKKELRIRFSDEGIEI